METAMFAELSPEMIAQLLFAGGVTVVTQLLRPLLPKIHPMAVAFGLSLLVGAAWAQIKDTAIMATILSKSGPTMAFSVLMYDMYKTSRKRMAERFEAPGTVPSG